MANAIERLKHDLVCDSGSRQSVIAYIGDRQYYATRSIKPGNRINVESKVNGEMWFMGARLIRVLEDDYLHVTAVKQ